MPKPNPRQYALDFSSATAEALATLRRLPAYLPNLPADLAAGVADLLERIALCSRDRTTSHARAATLAAGIDGRRTVSERTVRRWRAAAEQTATTAGPLLQIDHRSQRHGGHKTNAWTINWPAVRLLLADAPPIPEPSKAAAIPEPSKAGPRARHLAALALAMTEDQAEAALQTLAEAGQGADTGRPQGGHHDHPKAGHHDHPRGGHHDRPTVSRDVEPPPTQDSGREWRETIERIEAGGIAQAADLARLAQVRGQSPAAFEAEAFEALATAHANAGSLRSPAGAAAWKLRTGAWPDGLNLAHPAQLAARTQATDQAARQKMLEARAFCLLQEARHRTRAGHDPAAVCRELETGQPPAVLAIVRGYAFWTHALEAGAPQPCPTN